MAQMSLFEKTVAHQDKITWLDLLSGIKDKHSGDDVEYALLAGTASDRAATESAMLQKWKAPWIFLIVLASGAGLSVLAYLLADMFGHPAFIMLAFILPAFVAPIAVMILCWELNVPRNISFFQLMLCFFLGGIFSIAATLLLEEFNGLSGAVFAPLTEEPGKGFISLLLLYLFSRKKGFKIYGMTGLTLGAAVGAGFAAFESAYYIFGASIGGMLIVFTDQFNELLPALLYAYEGSGALGIAQVFFMGLFPAVQESYVDIALIRFCGAFYSHAVWCALYTTAAALEMRNHAYDPQAVKKKPVLLVFLFACVMHACNNLVDGKAWYALFAVELILEWWLLLRLVRKCFRQIGEQVGTANAGSVLATDLKLMCVSGAHAGRRFAIKHDSILIGTGGMCGLVYPMGTKGVSERQCKLVVQNGGLYLADAGSVDGTYLNGVRLKPLKGQILNRGDTFWLGSENEKFVVC